MNAEIPRDSVFLPLKTRLNELAFSFPRNQIFVTSRLEKMEENKQLFFTQESVRQPQNSTRYDFSLVYK